MRVKDNKKSEHSEEAKKRSRPEVSDYDPVPLYRSYGVTRREYPILNKIKTAIQQFTVIILLLPSCIALAFGIAMTVLYGKTLAFVLFTPGVQSIFNLVYLTWQQYLIGVGLIFVPLVVMELAKLFGFIKHHEHK